ncbi:MAG: glycoside hydrolase family 65 protein [Acidimicrobiia bacterium]|nr:glycoside hydrolase family 65 protein [Acidimicrobiia bacterium]
MQVPGHVLSPDPLWTVTFDGYDPDAEQVRERLLTIGDGQLGSTWTPFPGDGAAAPWVAVNGAYAIVDGRESLAACPVWNRLPHVLAPHDLTGMRRVLDMRHGTLHVSLQTAHGVVEASMFSSSATPGTVVMHGTAHRDLLAEIDPVTPAPADPQVVNPVPIESPPEVTATRAAWSAVPVCGGQVVATAVDHWTDLGHGERRFERVGRYGIVDADDDAEAWANRVIREIAAVSSDTLALAHVSAWEARWERADIRLGSDARLQQAVRFNLYHLMACVADAGEAAVGARGLSGPNYAGHVFWDTDIFVLPFMAATHPPAARAILEYRLRRLPAARRNAVRTGYAGARFPWESASSGEEVTPNSILDKNGREIPVVTAEYEQHITADVAWAARCYADWTGDPDFTAGALPRLLVETARFWASRAVLEEDGRRHIRHVIGPDEYHEDVDDSAFTNCMAAANLRDAARLESVAAEERDAWLGIADGLVTGLDETSGIYEEFAGFHTLAPLVVADLLERPAAADADLGYDVVHRSQVVKQADVVMLLHLLPDLADEDRLRANLDYYEPRTSHGSSLSPAIHAGLLARIGRFDDAVRWLSTSAMLDLHDVTGTAIGGVHTATMGGVWQALVYGFAGIRVEGEGLRVDPCLPPQWTDLEVRCVFRGSRIAVRIAAGSMHVTAEAPVPIYVGKAPVPVETVEARWEIATTGRA